MGFIQIYMGIYGGGGSATAVASPVDIAATGRLTRSITVHGEIQRTKQLTGTVQRSITVTGDTSEAV